jgi:hypothetical protein
MFQRLYWMLQRLYLIHLVIIPLRGPSCKLRLARFSAKLKLQDGPSVAKIQKIVATKKLFSLAHLLRSDKHQRGSPKSVMWFINGTYA